MDFKMKTFFGKMPKLDFAHSESLNTTFAKERKKERKEERKKERKKKRKICLFSL
jgi:hypothetical protein